APAGAWHAGVAPARRFEPGRDTLVRTERLAPAGPFAEAARREPRQHAVGGIHGGHHEDRLVVLARPLRQALPRLLVRIDDLAPVELDAPDLEAAPRERAGPVAPAAIPGQHQHPSPRPFGERRQLEERIRVVPIPRRGL